MTLSMAFLESKRQVFIGGAVFRIEHRFAANKISVCDLLG